MLDRVISTLVAVTLAVLVWLYARSRDQEMLDNVPIPVQITLAPGQADHYDLELTGPSQVLASFTGPPSRMRELRSWLHRGDMRVQVSLTVPEDRQNDSHYLDTVRIDAAELHPPPGVRALVVEERNRIPVTLRRVVERRLPVHLDHALEERIGQVVLEPAAVLVRGPQEILDRAQSIATQPLPLTPRTDESPLKEVVTAGLVPLVQEMEGRPVRCTPSAVAVHLTLRPRQKIYEVRDVPVQFLCPANFPLRPQWQNDRVGKISVRLVGPTSEETPAVAAYIDLTAGKFEAGQYADEPIRVQLPKDFQLAQNPPRSASFRLVALPPDRLGDPGFGSVPGP
jgi:hypothetical protein